MINNKYILHFKFQFWYNKTSTDAFRGSNLLRLEVIILPAVENTLSEDPDEVLIKFA